MNAALNRKVRSLLARYGREQVLKAVADAEGAELSQRRATPATRPPPKVPPTEKRVGKPRRSPLEVVEAAQVDPEIRPVMEQIALAYEAKEILPEPWRVRNYLESEGVDPARIRSRADALPKVVAVLAAKPRERLETLLGLWRKHAELGDFGMIAEAILGPPRTVAPAGER